jgi:DNA-binding YbaB/EbfC family protein
MGMDPKKLQQQMMEALQQAQQMQEEAAAEVVEASAGGGMVTVKANGNGEILEVKIAKEAIDPDDPEMLEDMVLAAVNEAIRSAQAVVESKMGGLMGGLGGLGLPGM